MSPQQINQIKGMFELQTEGKGLFYKYQGRYYQINQTNNSNQTNNIMIKSGIQIKTLMLYKMDYKVRIIFLNEIFQQDPMMMLWPRNNVSNDQSEIDEGVQNQIGQPNQAQLHQNSFQFIQGSIHMPNDFFQENQFVQGNIQNQNSINPNQIFNSFQPDYYVAPIPDFRPDYIEDMPLVYGSNDFNEINKYKPKVPIINEKSLDNDKNYLIWQIDETKYQNVTLQRQLDELKRQLFFSQRKTLRKKIKNRELKEKLEKIESNDNSKVSKSKENSQGKFQLVEQTKQQIQDTLNEKIKEYMVIEQDLQTRAHKAEMVKKLESEKQQAMRQLQDYKETTETQQAELIQDLQDENQHLEEQYKSSLKEKNTLEDKLDSVTTKLDKRDSFIDQLQYQIKELQNMLSQQEQNLQKINRFNDENKTKVRTLEQKLKQLQTGKLKEAKDQLSKIESERNVLQDMLASANKQLKMRESELAREKKKVEKMEKIAQINMIQNNMNQNKQAPPQQQNHNYLAVNDHHFNEHHQLISGSDFNDRDQQFMDDIEETVQQMKQQHMIRNQSLDHIEDRSKHYHSKNHRDEPSFISRQAQTPRQVKQIKRNNQSVNDSVISIHTPEIKSRLSNELRHKLLDKIRPKDSRERQSIDVLNKINEHREAAKFQVKYDKELNDYQNIINKPQFKNNSNGVRGLFQSSIELPNINNHNHRRPYPMNSNPNNHNYKSTENILI
ncbi:UNKNOWN [Stylonychia lemnae]|uniref:Uncharacterized protein n=1 Tax=Stylonychia lemnae TaxID=5949 RepID=A0A078ADA3_STYLE|nr:UNKNOWN [Stylonychia lemnae]|eukprot:CDW78843.1 UNKNOWN [Stylonychia lemnae]